MRFHQPFASASTTRQIAQLLRELRSRASAHFFQEVCLGSSVSHRATLAETVCVHPRKYT
jgi:hypothetical protein